MAMTELDPYRELLEIAQRERELIREQRWEELSGLEPRRKQLMAVLPSPPPSGARALLEQVRDLVDANAASLATAIERTRDELVQLAHGRRAMHGYAGAPGAPARFVDERR
jgi:hypothetical protein